MTSQDMHRLVEDDGAFRVYVITKLESLENRVGSLEAGQKELKNEVGVMHENQLVMTSKIDMTQHINYWGFGILTIVAVLVQIWGPKIKRVKSCP